MADGTGTGREHSHGGLACGVEPLHQRVHDVVGRDTPVARGKSTSLFLELQLIAEAPHND